MTAREWMNRFFMHMALAAGIFVLTLLMLERLVPGFVSPFVDLPDSLLIVVLTLATATGMRSAETRLWARYVSLIVFAVMALIGLMYVWSRVNDFGWSGIGLTCAIGLTACLFGYAMWQKEI